MISVYCIVCEKLMINYKARYMYLMVVTVRIFFSSRCPLYVFISCVSYGPLCAPICIGRNGGY